LTLSEFEEASKRSELSTDARFGIAGFVECSDIAAKLVWSDVSRSKTLLAFVGDKVGHIDQILTIGLNRQIRSVSLDVQVPKELKDFLMHFGSTMSLSGFLTQTLWKMIRIGDLLVVRE
jgi:hypothetical protein